jgi:hypothetical protein
MELGSDERLQLIHLFPVASRFMMIRGGEIDARIPLV